MTISATDKAERFIWWTALKHGGLLIAPGKLAEYFEETPLPISSFLTERLRRDVFAVLEGNVEKSGVLLDTIFEQLLGYSKSDWLKGSAVDATWTRKAVSGEAIKPRRVWKGVYGEVLPVFIPDSESLGQAQRLGVGRGRRTVSRVMEWLRLSGYKLAILTNGRQLRLIHAGVDYDAWCEWDIDLWFQEGAPGPQVDALRILLDHRSIVSPDGKTEGPLLAAIAASRKGQAELSSVLGERVRLAVEKLIEASSETIEKLDDGNRHGDIRRTIYIAATRLVMRMVVILFAEARELLPRDNPIYNSSYGLQGLREQLERLAGGRGTERLRHTSFAWPRLLGLFRLIYEGSRHEALVVQRYGGGLFQPGEATSSDLILRALAVLEHPNNAISDAIVHSILELLTRSKVKVRQGKGATWVEAPVDFSDLSSEYIGILYEGLLDFELRRADPDDPMVFLNIGDQPALPFSRLDEMDDKSLSQLLEKLKASTKKDMPVEGDEEDEDEESEDNLDDEDAGDESESEESDDSSESSVDEDVSDDASVWSTRIHTWARRAAIAAKLIKPPKGKKGASTSDAFEAELAKVSRQLIYKTILPGGWFLVRWGGTRKGAGTFYTRPQLAGPTTRRTLEPLLFEHQDDNRSIRKPEDILSLKVCDPAMGSGSFLVSALRVLTDALFESLHVHQRLEPGEDRTICRLADGLPADAPQHETLTVPLDHEDFEIRLKARLKRHVVERCLYGVDIDPLAVELARMSLWIETMDRNLPFHFLDHKLKCGNSLVGCWFDRFQDYPVMAWEREGGDKNHDRFVHHFHEYKASRGKKAGQPQRKGDKWTQAIKDFKDSVIKPEMRAWITARSGNVFSFMKDGYTTEDLHRDIRAVFEELHSLPVHEEGSRARLYRDRVLSNHELERLKTAFDTWCAIWFWPGDHLDLAPTPKNFLTPPEATKALVYEVAAAQRFFHWEIEFPDVFTGQKSGFHALIGNPPWEIQKPNSKEFFSNIDPLYRAYGKQEALRKQTEFFTSDEGIEFGWLDYSARLKSLSTWTKHAAFPFGDSEEDGGSFSFLRSAGENSTLHRLWRRQRARRRGFSDPVHPFRLQGSADINTYKLFLEMFLYLKSPVGRVGILLPSSVHNDKGSFDLRTKWVPFLDTIVKFDNERKIFTGLEHNSKFDILFIDSRAQRDGFSVAFFSWSDASVLDNLEMHLLPINKDFVSLVSPTSLSIPEIRSPQDSHILQIMYDNGAILGEVMQPSSEFHMTNDSKLFKGEGDFPLCQGGMIWLNDHRYNYFDTDKKKFVRGKLEDVDLRYHYPIIPKHWVNYEDYIKKFGDRKINGQLHIDLYRIAFRIQSSRSNQRTFISTIIPPGFATGNSICTLVSENKTELLLAQAIFSSFAHDFNVRTKISSNINNFYVPQFVFPAKRDSNIEKTLAINTLKLIATSCIYEQLFTDVIENYGFNNSWNKECFAISEYERRRLTAINDALIFYLYGLREEDVRYLLSTFNGVDRKLPMHLRQTTITLIAFIDLQRQGLVGFIDIDGKSDWVIPTEIDLRNYGIESSCEDDPVANIGSYFGPKYLKWQTSQSIDEAWEKSEHFAKKIQDRVQGLKKTTLNSKCNPINDNAESKVAHQPQTTDLFGNVIRPFKRKKRS